MKPCLALAALVLAVLLAPDCAVAQERGRIEGIVMETGIDRGLGGVNVYLKDTVFGVSTSFDGRYRLDEIAPGTYLLVVSLLGFGQETRTVTVQAGETVRADFVMTERPVTLDEVIAQGERTYSAASSASLRGFDLRIRPVTSSQELLRLAPGLVIAQHAGGGKAEQIFLRGFDADHGTDVALSVDGVPVNMVSHGHGQGYADLHFIIPETVEEMEVRKGPYFAGVGNLGTAGAVSFRTKEHFASNLARLELGSFETARLTTIYQIPLPGEHQGAYLAGQFLHTEGPFEVGQQFRRGNLFGKFHTHLSETAKLAVSLSGFSSAWDASGQVPVRAIEAGLIDRFGAIDDREGGTTARQDMNFAYEVHSGDNRDLTIQGYTSRYNFKLFSNFTFFLENPTEGDMIEQIDDRRIFGLNSRYRFSERLGTGGLAATTLGGGFRNDDIEVGLWQSPNRRRAHQLVSATIHERNLYLWVEEELIFSPQVRLQLGLRGDYFTFNVEDDLEGQPATLPHASGYAQQTILSPKANLVVTPVPALDLFFNAGSGFHSNDARNVIIGARVADLARDLRREGLSDAEIDAELEARQFDPAQRGAETLPRALGAEVGMRVRLGGRLVASVAWWGMDLEREFVYVGDGGFTELSGASRRLGVDLEARLQLTPWLWADGDATLSRGTFKDEPDGLDEIPLAPRRTFAGGLSARHPSGFEGSLRLRHVGDRPANEDGSVTAEGFTVFDLVAAYPVGSLRFNLSLENLFDVTWNEAQFDTESRLFDESQPTSELHFTPGAPFSVRAGVSYLF